MRKTILIALLACASFAAAQLTPVTSTPGQPTGTQGQPSTAAAAGNVTTSPVFIDASKFPVTTGSGAVDVCAEAVAAETAEYASSNGSAGYVIVPVPNKAYCSELPQAANFHGEVYFVGSNSRARIYTSVSWTGFSAGIHIHGTGPQGTAQNTDFNTILTACNPILHDNGYPTTGSSAPCAAYFNSTTNMSQATVTSITAASGGSSTITLSSALSGTILGTYAGRWLCVGKETTTAGNGNCYEINAEPTGGGTIFTVNSTTLVACAATCGGTAYLDTPLVDLTPGTGQAGFFIAVSDMGLDCAYVYACGVAVNGSAEEGSYFRDVQMFNGTVYGYRKYVGNNTSPASYGGSSGGASHSGPDQRIFFNFLSETCENNSNSGCYGTDGTHGAAGNKEAVGTLMACGDNTKLTTNQAILSYSSTKPMSPCQKNFAGLATDGIAMGTNSNSLYGVDGITISLKDVFNTGTHVAMPELTNGIGIFAIGPTSKVDGFHVEYATTCVEVGGDATQNESWIEDGSTLTQSVTFINGDINNCQNPASGSPTGWAIDIGAANGTTNAINAVFLNISGTTGSHMLQNNVVSNASCTNSSEKNIWYILAQTATSALVQSDCSTANEQMPTLTQTDIAFTTPAAHSVIIGEGTTTKATGIADVAAGSVFASNGTSADPGFTATPTLGAASTTNGTLTVASSGSATTVTFGENSSAQATLNNALALTGTTAATTTIATTNTNQSLTLAPNGTGPIIVNVGTASAPTVQATGSASNTGIDMQTTALLWTATGTAVAGLDNNGAVVGDNKGLVFSQTATANGTAGAEVSAIGSGGTEALAINAGTSTNLISLSGSACKLTSAVTLTTTTTICTWTLPNVAQTWSYYCKGMYQTTTTSITLLLGTQFAQAPTVSTHAATIWSAASTQTYAQVTNTGTTATTTMTGVAPSSGTATPWEAWGSFTGSATSGTFVLYGTASTTSDAQINAGSSCYLF